MKACRQNRPLTAELLLKWGARIEVGDEDNWTALHWACQVKRMDFVQLLMFHNSPTGDAGHVCIVVFTDWQPC